MRIGIDLGGTKIAGIALDDEDNTLTYERIPAASQDYELTLRKIVQMVKLLESKAGQAATIGIGTPGAISPTTGLMRNSNSAYLNLKPVDRDLEEALGRPVRLRNDADCFALSEATDGAAAGAHSVFGVIIGTGVGGGLVFNGQLVTGANAVAGEWGHCPLPYARDDERPGLDCYCGHSGCIETFLSGPGMAIHYRNSGGQALTAREIIAQADRNPLAAVALDTYIERLARALSVVINIFDPEIIVLGGGLSNIDALYERVPRHWGEYVFSDSVQTRLVKNLHGDDSGVRGAAGLYAPGELSESIR